MTESGRSSECAARAVIHANLDCEARWGGGSLPAHVARRISALSALLSVLTPADVVEVWALTEVDRSRLRPCAAWRPPEMRAGQPSRIDLAWADSGARRVNDRRFALAVADAAGCALAGARAITSLDELDRHVADLRGGAWVCKAPWTTAGRDRWFGHGEVIDPAARRAVAAMIARQGAVVLEPWLERILDVAVCGRVAPHDGAVELHAPHRILTGARGGFRGIALGATGLEPAEHDRLRITAERVGGELHRAGYTGPFGIDAFVYRDGDARRLHPLCEINARWTFGHVAHALDARAGIATLGFGLDPPSAATILVAPSPSDRAAVWFARG